MKKCNEGDHRDANKDGVSIQSSDVQKKKKYRLQSENQNQN